MRIGFQNRITEITFSEPACPPFVHQYLFICVRERDKISVCVCARLMDRKATNEMNKKKKKN